MNEWYNLFSPFFGKLCWFWKSCLFLAFFLLLDLKFEVNKPYYVSFLLARNDNEHWKKACILLSIFNFVNQVAWKKKLSFSSSFSGKHVGWKPMPAMPSFCLLKTWRLIKDCNFIALLDTMLFVKRQCLVFSSFLENMLVGNWCRQCGDSVPPVDPKQPPRLDNILPTFFHFLINLVLIFYSRCFLKCSYLIWSVYFLIQNNISTWTTSNQPFYISLFWCLHLPRLIFFGFSQSSR